MLQGGLSFAVLGWPTSRRPRTRSTTALAAGPEDKGLLGGLLSSLTSSLAAAQKAAREPQAVAARERAAAAAALLAEAVREGVLEVAVTSLRTTSQTLASAVARLEEEPAQRFGPVAKQRSLALLAADRRETRSAASGRDEWARQERGALSPDEAALSSKELASAAALANARRGEAFAEALERAATGVTSFAGDDGYTHRLREPVQPASLPLSAPLEAASAPLGSRGAMAAILGETVFGYLPDGAYEVGVSSADAQRAAEPQNVLASNAHAPGIDAEVDEILSAALAEITDEPEEVVVRVSGDEMDAWVKSRARAAMKDGERPEKS